MKEKLIVKFKLPHITDLSMIELISFLGYKETGNKFSVSFNGSKGYLSELEIRCEGSQEAENRIFIDSVRNKDKTFKNVLVNVFYSNQNGIRLSTGIDEARLIVKKEPKVYTQEGLDELSF